MAIIFFKHQGQRSMIPARLSSVDFDEFPRTGHLKLSFDYEGEHKTFTLPFTRPYANRAEGKLAQNINLNMSRVVPLRNTEFEEFQQRITDDFRLEIKVDGDYVIHR